MTEDQLFESTYNLHEAAENAAHEALIAYLRDHGSIDALACLCDPAWRWETRSWMSEAIIDQANDILDEKLEALVVA